MSAASKISLRMGSRSYSSSNSRHMRYMSSYLFQPLSGSCQSTKVGLRSFSNTAKPLVEPQWKKIVVEKKIHLEDIQKARLTKKIWKDISSLDPKRFKLMCRVCDKPNALSVSTCTACEFELSPLDVEEIDPNPFIKIINSNSDHVVVYRDSDIVIFEDKFKISEHHLDAIPVRVISDLTHLRAADIKLIEHLHAKGLEVLQKKNIALFRGRNLEDHLITGFNLPVSVYHLHLHLVLPPLKHIHGFEYPRFHPYDKVLRDLKTFGHVRPYYQHPDELAGRKYHEERVVKNHLEMVKEAEKLNSSQQNQNR